MYLAASGIMGSVASDVCSALVIMHERNITIQGHGLLSSFPVNIERVEVIMFHSARIQYIYYRDEIVAP
jgi:hypothetical protein